MEKPNIPGIAALGAMTDTLDFVKKMWGNLGVPGMAAPSLSLAEIDKKIADLRAVESWLTLNMNMLRGTIQALEVQSGTIAALQSMGAAIGAAATPPADQAPPFESPFAPAARQEAPRDAPPAAPKPALDAPPAGMPGIAPGMPDFGTASVNPAAWWNLLQDQFRQAVSKAVSEPAAEAPAAAPAKPARPAARKEAAAAKPRKRKSS